MLGVLTVLMLFALPRSEAAAAPTPVARDLSAAGHLPGAHADEDGACEEVEPQELLECGSQYDDMLDQPIVLSLLRALGVRLTADACDELLADLWAKEVCEIGSLDCGRMNQGAPPGRPLELISGSSSGHSSWAHSLAMPTLDMSGMSAFADRASAFDSRDLQPPVPPPR
jgi:hypothetical protein